jgi:hypothetical protein
MCRFSKPVPSTTRPSLQAVVAHDTCVDDYSVVIAWRRRRDSNPRSSRSAVFKTAAFDHSATPPGHPEVGRQYMDAASLVKDQPGAFGAGMLASPPTYGRSASGMPIDPSARWYCSRIATSVRPIATPEPLSVCAGRGFSPAAVR